jgi:two-component system cell cycle response regulator
VNVLLAHGSAASRRRIGRVLRAGGFTVDEAADAAQALVRCQETPPDVLVIARGLGEREGIDLIERVKTDLDVFRIAIVVIASADLTVEHAKAELARGAHDFLVEPVGDAEMVARVQAAGRMKILQEELAQQTLRVESQLFEDPLTRLYNRRFLFAQLHAMVSGARRHKRPLAVAMVDLDRFKAVNDEHGHDAGDQVLVAAAGALRKAIRAEDVLGRLGGEEFLALLPDTNDAAAARAAERMRAAVTQSGGPVTMTASVGWATLRDAEAPGELVARADDALYTAKAAGRDRVEGPATLPRRR